MLGSVRKLDGKCKMSEGTVVVERGRYPARWGESSFYRNRRQFLYARDQEVGVFVVREDEPLLQQYVPIFGLGLTTYLIRRSWWRFRLRVESKANQEPVWRVGVFAGRQQNWQWSTAVECYGHLTLREACSVADRMSSKYSQAP